VRKLNREDFCGVLGITPENLDVRRSLGQTALAFGLAKPIRAGRYFALDLIGMFLADRFADFLGRKTAAETVRFWWDVWLDGLGRAEYEKHYGCVFLVGKRNVPGRASPLLFVSAGTFAEVTSDLNALPNDELPTDAQYMDMLVAAEAVRHCAKVAGVELGPPPFFLPPTDPRYEQIITAGSQVREAFIRREKKRWWKPCAPPKPPAHVERLIEGVLL
jgi:hypothetical protein